MRHKLPWILFAGSLLLNGVFLGGVLFGWAGLKSDLLDGRRPMAEMAEQLSLTPRQIDGLKALRDDIGARGGAFRQARQSLRAAVLAEMRQPEFDREAVLAVMGENAAERHAFFADVAGDLHGYLQSLEPDQRERFLELAEERGFMRRLIFGNRHRGGDRQRD